MIYIFEIIWIIDMLFTLKKCHIWKLMLKNTIIKWIKCNTIVKSLQLWRSSRNLYYLLLHVSKVPTRKILKGREVIREEIILLANKITAK